MVDEKRAGEDPSDSEGKKRSGVRSGEDRRKAERRTLEIPVEKDRRSGWDRRQRDRRKG